MNNTKWNEIFQTFYENECHENSILVRWRTKDKESGYLSDWDGTWTHFGCDPRNWNQIDYLQIELTDINYDYVIRHIKEIHVPGTIDKQFVTIYGYKDDVDYI